MKKSTGVGITPRSRKVIVPQKKEERKLLQYKEQAIQAEGCPYHNGQFDYLCFICNPR